MDSPHPGYTGAWVSSLVYRTAHVDCPGNRVGTRTAADGDDPHRWRLGHRSPDRKPVGKRDSIDRRLRDPHNPRCTGSVQ